MDGFETLANVYWPLIAPYVVIIAEVSATILIAAILWFYKHEYEEVSKGDLLFYVLILAVVGVYLISIGQLFYYFLFLVAVFMMIILR